MPDTSQIEFRRATLEQGDGAVLVAAMRDEIALIYDGLDLEGPVMPRAGAAELGPPHGAFLVGYRGDEPICCGGVKRLDERHCELKRMYVVPAARGQGIARRLLQALEQTARELGFRVARLDTGARQPAARHLYESAGYAEIGNFNDNPVAVFFGEKRLL